VTGYVVGAGQWASPRLQPADEAVSAWAAATLATIGAGAEALCVATLDSGARESMHFWRASRASGLAFANPRPVPWALSTSATGRIARELDVRGPTYTIVGRADALTAALEHALDELASRRARRVLVAALDGVSVEETRLAALVLADAPARETLAAVAGRPQPGRAALVDRGTASATLAAAVERLVAREEVVLGSDRDGWIGFEPL
jgi:hypothetical protein